MMFRYGENGRWYMLGRVRWTELPKGARPSEIYRRAGDHSLGVPTDPESIALLRCCDTIQEHDIALALRVACRVSQRLQRPVRQILGLGRMGGLWASRGLMVACSMRLGVNREEIGELMGRGAKTLTNYSSGFRSRSRRDPDLRRAYFEIVEAEQFAACCYADGGQRVRGCGQESAW